MFHFFIGFYRILKYTIPIVIVVFFYEQIGIGKKLHPTEGLIDLNVDTDAPVRQAFRSFAVFFSLAFGTGVGLWFNNFLQEIKHKNGKGANKYVAFGSGFGVPIVATFLGSFVIENIYKNFFSDFKINFSAIESYQGSLFFGAVSAAIAYYFFVTQKENTEIVQPDKSNENETIKKEEAKE
jgi:hypothetical protein